MRLTNKRDSRKAGAYQTHGTPGDRALQRAGRASRRRPLASPRTRRADEPPKYDHQSIESVRALAVNMAERAGGRREVASWTLAIGNNPR